MTGRLQPAPRTRASGQDTRRRVLAAAEQLFAASPYAAVTIRDIAAVAGADPALVIRYFGSKAELFLRARQPQLQPMPDVDGLKDPEQLTRWLVELLSSQGQRLFDITAADAAGSRLSISTQLDEILVRPVLAAIDGTEADRIHIELIAAVVIGAIFVRDRIGTNALADATPAALVRHLTPVVAALLQVPPAESAPAKPRRRSTR